MRVERRKLTRDPKRRHSSTRWLQRQINDPFVQAAKRDGYRARSAYKLAEIDEKHGLLRPGARVLDLGAAPGSWSQYAVRRGARVVAVDLLEMDPMNGVQVIRGDFLDGRVQDRLREALAGPADLVLSDIAADATGRRIVDRLRAEAIGEEVLAFAGEVLAPEGRALLKLVKGAEVAVIESGRAWFRSFRQLRPKATRSESSELFLLASGRLSTDEE